MRSIRLAWIGILFLLAAVMTSGLGVSGVAKAEMPADRPNIVLIISDDMGYADLSKFGDSEIPTPNLDRLADGGTRFTNAYVTAPICVPSRMGIMTGRYQQRYGVYDNFYGESLKLFKQEITLADVFKSAGYATGLVGKWHLGDISKPAGSHPLERGFDEFVGIPGGMSGFFKDAALYRGYEKFKAPEYLTDFFGKEACAFIDEHQDESFFLMLSFNAVHAPLHALDEDKSAFAELDSPDRQTYAGMLRAMDRNIGLVLDKLAELHLDENTIVAFYNDNGGGGNHTPPHTRNTARNAPLRGYKFDLFEGGIRVPFLLKWPGRVPAGEVYSEPVISLDLFPTFLAAAGMKLPADRTYDGVDLLPCVTGQVKQAPHDVLCWKNREWDGPRNGQKPVPGVYHSAIRRGQWKMVRLSENAADAEPPAWLLFDLARDPGEQHDLALEYPQVVKQLDAEFDKWLKQMHALLQR